MTMSANGNDNRATNDTVQDVLAADESVLELKNIIEAALLASEVPLSTRKLMNLFPAEARPDRKDFDAALELLAAQCQHSSIELRKIDKGWRLQTKEKYAPWLRKLRESRPPRYSRALLETLSIIAYRQPVSRADIENIRGVSVTTDMMRTLIDREWIAQVGYRDVPGRPALWGTTKTFLEYFNLSSLSQLPALHEKRDMAAIAQELNITVPLEDAPTVHDADVINDDSHDGDDRDQRAAQDAHPQPPVMNNHTPADESDQAQPSESPASIADVSIPLVDDVVRVDDDDDTVQELPARQSPDGKEQKDELDLAMLGSRDSKSA